MLQTEIDWTVSAAGILAQWKKACRIHHRGRDCLEPLGLSDRLMRLLAAGFARLSWELVPTDMSHHVRLSENLTPFPEGDLYEGSSFMIKNWGRGGEVVWYATKNSPDPGMVAYCGWELSTKHKRRRLLVQQGKLVVSIVGPGWDFDPSWRSREAVSLAREAYENRDWSLCPILADALEEAGCDEVALLESLRDSGQVWCRGSRIIDDLLNLR
jgi:hypothetical protein